MTQRIRLDDGPTYTTAQLTRRLNVSPLAVLAWRRGSGQRVPLPVGYEQTGTKAHRVHFAEADLLEWLYRYRPDLHSLWVSQ